ncbi:MAG: PilZ domain-containing protein [Magnetococcales bacterium]|nr:PilZ domain-containing protein [Magnetococcales bacterium]
MAIGNGFSGKNSGAPMPVGRRKWDRHTYAQRLELHLGPEVILTGKTRDVSLNGVFLLTEKTPSMAAVGDHGVLKLHLPDGEVLDFPCRLTRVTQEGVALNLGERAAAFGMALTREIFSDMGGKKP